MLQNGKKYMDRAKISFINGTLYAPVEPDRTVPCGNGTESHPVSELFLVAKGSCRYGLNGREITLHAGDSCLIFPWVPHLYGFRADDGYCEQIWLHIPDGFFVVVCHEKDQPFHTARRGQLPQEYMLLLQRLIRDFRRSGKSASLKTFFELFMLESEKLMLHFQDRKTDLAESVKIRIRTRNGVNCSLGELEKYTGYSRSHIAHTFRKECGFSIGEYINTVRREYTVQALAFGMKQKEIAAALGFSSPSAFWQWYRKFR